MDKSRRASESFIKTGDDLLLSGDLGDLTESSSANVDSRLNGMKAVGLEAVTDTVVVVVFKECGFSALLPVLFSLSESEGMLSRSLPDMRSEPPSLPSGARFSYFSAGLKSDFSGVILGAPGDLRLPGEREVKVENGCPDGNMGRFPRDGG